MNISYGRYPLAIIAFLVVGGMTNAVLKNATAGFFLGSLAGWAIIARFWDGLFGNDTVRDPYLPGLHHERTHEHRWRGSLIQVVNLLDRFAQVHLQKWHKADERVTPDGKEINLRYEYSFTKTWRLKAGSIIGFFQCVLRASQESERNRDSVVPVPYDLQCYWTIGEAEPGWVNVTLRVVEDIDPMQTNTEWPLGKHYLAPSFLYTEGYFGIEVGPYLATARP